MLKSLKKSSKENRFSLCLALPLAPPPGDMEVAAFLKDEIATEAQNSRALPKLPGWEVKPDGAEVTLAKVTPRRHLRPIPLHIFPFIRHPPLYPDDWRGEGDDHPQREPHRGQRAARRRQ